MPKDLELRYFPVTRGSRQKTHADWDQRIGYEAAESLVRYDVCTSRFIGGLVLGLMALSCAAFRHDAGPVLLPVALVFWVIGTWNLITMNVALYRATSKARAKLGEVDAQGRRLQPLVRHGVDRFDKWISQRELRRDV